MSIDQIKQHIAKASTIVAAWQKWKRNILENSGRPTRSETKKVEEK